MHREMLRANLRRPVSRIEITKHYCRGMAVLDIGCVNHNLEHVEDRGWIHRAITEVAESVLGLDYLEDEVQELAKRGYRVIAADVNKPIEIEERFDVIVVGHLIEHLSSFEGLMLNIGRLLKPGGCALISTPNPFYTEQYFYSAFKNDIIVNPEHTCWVDPVTLDQLARQFGLATTEVHWIEEKWKLHQVILNSPSRSFDVLTGKWNFEGTPSAAERVIAPVLRGVFQVFAPRSLSRRVFAKYDHERMPRLLYLRFLGVLFQAFWAVYRQVVVTSPINRYEVFLSVLKRV
ncbi:MAG: class I SAM-dependent methyltransferase [Betaproteobacteria bacterium]|nr:MAG: class I SAM-dependent methyltransferase [Betaproteobacteria bacterium]